MKTIFLLALVLCSGVLCKQAIDIAPLFNDYGCFVKNGYDLAIVRAYRSIGQIDANANVNLKNAISAGMKTDVYMFPCINDSKITAEQQVDDMINNLAQPTTVLDRLQSFTNRMVGGGLFDTPKSNGDTYGTIWVDVETNPSSTCTWDLIASVEDRCAYLQRIVNQIVKRGKKVGIYASHYMWVSIFGDENNCKNFSSLPLWYARYNNVQNTSDYSQYPFGGWASAWGKQYAGSVNVCNADVDTSFYN